MTRPRASEEYFKERAGVIGVARLLNAARVLFREVDHGDVGIDGYAEQVAPNGEATGRVVALQLKSGVSYFDDDRGAHWRFYPEAKHRMYWSSYPLPVVLVLHDPRDEAVYWADARSQLRMPGRTFIDVPKEARLSGDSSVPLFEMLGPPAFELLDVNAVVRLMASAVHPEGSFHISFLDLFLEGITDLGRKLFFSAPMAVELAEARLPDDAPTGVGMGGAEQDFLDSYVRFLVEQSLAYVDYADVMIDVVERSLFPVLLVPLTPRGQAVIVACRAALSTRDRRAFTEAPVGISWDPVFIMRRFANLDAADSLRQQFESNEIVPDSP